MNINNDAALKMREKYRKLLEGRIKCQCGNVDWEQFLYMEVGDVVMAGCKLCGSPQMIREQGERK